MISQPSAALMGSIRPAPGVLLACALLGLSACAASNTEKDFLCPAQMGSPCTTIAAADGGGAAAGRPLQERGEDVLAGSLTQTPLQPGKGAPTSGMGDGGFAYDAASYRLPEKVGTLWIAPHAEGETLFEATYVHFLILPAAWGDRP
jgi:conjugal transfer pilus assembly protein TraV